MITPSKRKLGEGYPFHYRKGPSEKGGTLVCTHHCTFRTRKNRRYAVQVEQCQHHVYVLQHYPLSHKNSPNKFRVLTHDGDAFRILTICFQIFLDIYRRDPLASAGFIGEALVGEHEVNTKRFRVYMQSVLTFANPDHFTHHPALEASAYFLENKANPEPNLTQQVEQMFHLLYILPQGLGGPATDTR